MSTYMISYKWFCTVEVIQLEHLYGEDMMWRGSEGIQFANDKIAEAIGKIKALWLCSSQE